jgi:hypothetical protein
MVQPVENFLQHYPNYFAIFYKISKHVIRMKDIPKLGRQADLSTVEYIVFEYFRLNLRLLNKNIYNEILPFKALSVEVIRPPR